MAIVGKSTHRMPMETTAEYSRFRSMGKQGIEEKERKRKERIIREKDKRREEDTRKRNRFPRRAQTRGYSAEKHIECPWKLRRNTADLDQWAN